MNKRVFALAAALALTSLPSSAVAAGEIPAFARKYNVSCNLRHNPAPTLTAVGEESAGNGFGFRLQRGAPPVGRGPRDGVLTILAP